MSDGKFFICTLAPRYERFFNLLFRLEFGLGVPGEINRRHRGTLSVEAIKGLIVPIVTMDLEAAVAAVVAAESAPGASMETLKAQAVVTRSYFIAGKSRHHDFDFCDLTHCQFLRDPRIRKVRPASHLLRLTVF